MLVADAICSSEDFATTFRQEIAAIFPEHPLERLPRPTNLHRQVRRFRAGDVWSAASRSGNPPAALEGRVRQVEPELEALKLGDHYAVLFSNTI